MIVYVARVHHLYPDVDGEGYPIGVYSSEEKAREACDKAAPEIEYYLGVGEKRVYEFIIDEFEVDSA